MQCTARASHGPNHLGLCAIQAMMRSKHLGDEVVQGVQYMTYYAHIAYVKQVYFIAEIVAYDISMICETAYQNEVDYQNAIVSLLLEVDEVPDDKAQLETLRGVRKAQVKLATFYLLKGETAKAMMIRQDMADEPPERLNSIREELESVESATFWELEDRGYNFEFLPLERRLKLDQFLVRDLTTWIILQKMTLITADCGATRSLIIKWP